MSIEINTSINSLDHATGSASSALSLTTMSSSSMAPENTEPISSTTKDSPMLEDDIVKWRAERRAKYPSLRRENKDTKQETEPEAKTESKTEVKPEAKEGEKESKRRKPNKSYKQMVKHRPQLTLHDKMFLTDVHREEDKIIRCLQMLMER